MQFTIPVISNARINALGYIRKFKCTKGIKCLSLIHRVTITKNEKCYDAAFQFKTRFRSFGVIMVYTEPLHAQSKIHIQTNLISLLHKSATIRKADQT